MFDFTTKLEVNVVDKVDIQELVQLATRSKVAAIVVPSPEMIPQLQFMRLSVGGLWRIILAVDFSTNGSLFGLTKFSSMSPAWLAAEGYDILLSPRRNPMEIKNEIAALIKHLRALNAVCEVRFCIDALTNDRNIVNDMIKFIHSQNQPRATMIRLQHDLQMRGRDAKEYAPKMLQIIRNVTSIPVKLSTNVTLDVLRQYKDQFIRFDTSLHGLKTIVGHLKDEAIGGVKVPEKITEEVPSTTVADVVTQGDTCHAESGECVSESVTEGQACQMEFDFSGSESVFSDPIQTKKLIVPEIGDGTKI